MGCGLWAIGDRLLAIGLWVIGERLKAKGERRGNAAKLLTLPITFFLKQEYGTACLQKYLKKGTIYLLTPNNNKRQLFFETKIVEN